MKRFFGILILAVLISSCGNEEVVEASNDQVETTNDTIQKNEKGDLIDIKGDLYTEYYPNGKSIRFQGRQDDENRRHGKWTYFSESGQELSTTMYYHGKKHGHSIVKYPNGVVHYYGEYDNDKKIGIWKSYKKTGELIEEKDFGNGTEE